MLFGKEIHLFGIKNGVIDLLFFFVKDNSQGIIIYTHKQPEGLTTLPHRYAASQVCTIYSDSVVKLIFS